MTYTYNDRAILKPGIGGSTAIIHRPAGMFDFQWKTYAASVVDALNSKGSTSALELGEAIHKAMLGDAQESPSMKLVDILARELKVWPECVVRISQLTTGQVLGTLEGARLLNLGVFGMASDFGMKPVTRAEWQAAVDALNAPKADAQADDTVSVRYLIGHGLLTSIAHVDWPRRVYSFDLPPSLRDLDAKPEPKGEPKPVEWDGVGLPPAGVECDVLGDIDGGYTSAHILMHDGSRAVFRYTAGKNIGDHDSACADVIFGRPIFRPIKTAEQLATEQRARAVSEMVDTLKRFNSIHEACGMLYDAGYIKP